MPDALRPGRNDPCPCGSGKKYKRCCLDQDRAAPLSEAIEPKPTRSPALTLLVETPGGLMRRRIPSASPLGTHGTQGRAAEDAAQDAAALWGLPDFVYRPEIREVGSGTRELGDGILIVGDLGVVIQVKSREALSQDTARERRWVDKQTGKALKQASGTVRQLNRGNIALTNARGRTLDVECDRMRWIVTAIIDHESHPSDVVPALRACPEPSVVLLRRDWEFLFDQLKSTHAVGGYLERVADEPLELGREPIRYYELAAADARATPDELDPQLLYAGGRQVSSPVLPLAPAASDHEMAHRVVRSIFEDIATTHLTQSVEEHRVRVLAELDRLPVTQRATIGQFLLDGLSRVSRVAPPATEWRLRTIRGGSGKAHLGFGTSSQLSELHQQAFSAWLQLRHHQLQQITGEQSLTSVGVLLTPRRDGQRPWDTTMAAVSGELGLTADETSSYEELWPLDTEEGAQNASDDDR